MSIQQAHAFRDYVNMNAEVQEELRTASKTGQIDILPLAAKHNFDFTAEEAVKAWEDIKEGELSKFELLAVSAGKGEAGGKGAPGTTPGLDFDLDFD